MIRLFVEADLKADARVTATQDQAHYLAHVMRLKAGDHLLLFNGQDGEWNATVVGATKRGVMLSVETMVRAHRPGPDLELVAALVKRSRLETIVEKAAELGCKRVRLAITRRTNAERANVQRLQAIAVEAAEQCERLDVPEVLAPEKLDRILDGWQADRRLMFCDESGTDWAAGTGSAPPPQRIAPALDAMGGQAPGPWAVLIGPEGGFDPEEQQKLRSLDFVVPVSLGPRILRADTAAISALTLWQAALGDWRAESWT